MKNLILDFDDCEMLGMKIGSFIPDISFGVKLKSTKLGYVIYTEERLITGIFICLKNRYREFNVFKGKCQKGKKNIEITSLTKPDDLISIFGEVDDKWNDGVIETCIFKNNICEFEFSWDVRGEESILNYLIIDLKYKLKKELIHIKK